MQRLRPCPLPHALLPNVCNSGRDLSSLDVSHFPRQLATCKNLQLHNKMNPLFIQFSLYVVVGTALMVSNTLLLIAIGRSSSLRRKYAVLMAEFFTDGLSGLAQICAGAGRMTVMLTVPSTTLRSRRFCMFMPWNLLFIWTDPMSSIVLLIISIDRLFSLICPVAYYKHSLRFQITQITAWHSFMLASIFTSWSIAFQENEDKYDPICWSSASMVSWYNRYSFLLRMMAVVASIVLYLFVYGMSRRHGKRLAALGGNVQGGRNAFDVRQRQLTVTMGISCLFTVVLYLLPVSLEYFLDGILPADLEPFLTTYSLISTNLNPITNVYIIVRRHVDVARALYALVPFKFLLGGQTATSVVSTVPTTTRTLKTTSGFLDSKS